MLKSLTLTNFKRHENLHLDFTDGLVVIRGANEAGKSSLFNAIAYALYGSRALPGSLEGTVTYGKLPSSLRVVLVFTHDNVEYTITRSKSGAVLSGNGVTANGQSEVTAFIERLFNVSLAVAPKVMIANQNGLRGALEGGGAIALIEQLSGLDLIDDLITRIQTKLPSGNTKAIEQFIAELEKTEEPVANFEPLKADVAHAASQFMLVDEEVKARQACINALDIETAHSTIRQAAFIEGQIKQLKQREIDCETKIAKPLKFYELVDIDALRRAKALQQEAKKLLIAYSQFEAIKEVQVEYNLTLSEFKDGLAKYQMELSRINTLVSDTRVKIATTKGRRINDESCSLCGKLLQDVPEVVAGNAAVDAELQALDNIMINAMADRNSVIARIDKAQSALSIDNVRRIQAAKLEGYIETIDLIPLQVKWKGSAPKSLEPVDYDALITAAELGRQARDRELTLRQQAESELAHILSLLPTLQVVDTFEAREVLSKHSTLVAELAITTATRQTANLKLAEANNSLAVATANYNAAVDNHRKTLKQITSQKATLDQYYKNNDLIKKLREARPIVAKQLWHNVLHGVSHYFSQVRGITSVVTKSESGFLVDGKPSSDLSGSTLDSFGLGTRMALQKTFLPNLDFMLLDEPAAAADVTRETAMLGVLSASGYNQVVLVTHSDLADSFATQVVQI